MRSPLPRARLAAVVAVSLMATLGAEPAAAKVTAEKSIWGPLTVAGKSTMPYLERLGVGIFQTQLRWERVAPTRPANPTDPSDPAYVWPSAIDATISATEPYGIDVLLLVQGAPPWANGGQAWNFPGRNPKHFADFMTAAARRYPEVRRWMIWGEPNGYAVETNGMALSNFMGIEGDNGRPLPRRKTRGPRLYARYLDGAYKALKRESRSNIVIGGNTWAAGAVRPLHWIKALKLPNGKPPRMDQYGHNPGSERIPNIKKKPQARGTADFSDLDTLMKAIDKHLDRTPKRSKIGVHLSEWTILTDHGIPGIDFFVSEEVKARWITAGMKIVRKYKRVKSLGMHRLVDVSEGVGNHPHWGLLRPDGTEKLSFQAFANG